MRAITSCLVFSLAVSLLALQTHAAAFETPSASPSPPPMPPEQEIGAFASRLVPVEDDLIARVYTQTLRERFGDTREGRAKLREHLQAQRAAAAGIAFGTASIETGEHAGAWRFDSPGGGLPTRAWRDVDRSGAHGYEAERIGYCRDEEAACADWFAVGRDRSVRPAPDAGERAEREWVARVMQEPCVQRPARRPSEMPLRTAVSRFGLERAEVVLRLLHNPCGEVRRAEVVRSSGDRGIDRAAIEWAEKLIAPLEGRKAGYQSRLPFVFFGKDQQTGGPDAPP